MKICSISGSWVWTSIHFRDINPGPAISQKLTHWDQHTLHLPPMHRRPQIWRHSVIHRFIIFRIWLDLKWNDCLFKPKCFLLIAGHAATMSRSVTILVCRIAGGWKLWCMGAWVVPLLSPQFSPPTPTPWSMSTTSGPRPATQPAPSPRTSL